VEVDEVGRISWVSARDRDLDDVASVGKWDRIDVVDVDLAVVDGRYRRSRVRRLQELGGVFQLPVGEKRHLCIGIDDARGIGCDGADENLRRRLVAALLRE